MLYGLMFESTQNNNHNSIPVVLLFYKMYY